MGYTKHTIRGLTIYSDKSADELMEAAEKWKAGKGHDSDLELLWEELPVEKRLTFLKGAELNFPEEETGRRSPHETKPEHLERMEKSEALRQKFIEKNARSTFAGKLLPTREERIASLLNAPPSAESQQRLDSIAEREQEAKDRKREAREAVAQQRRQEGY